MLYTLLTNQESKITELLYYGPESRASMPELLAGAWGGQMGIICEEIIHVSIILSFVAEQIFAGPEPLISKAPYEIGIIKIQ